MRFSLYIIFCLIGLSLEATDTLHLTQWSVSNEGINSPIAFRGARNILHVIREAQSKETLKPRFSQESRAFHDSVASIEHTVQTAFDLTPKQLKSQVVELELNYLQTFTEIWINNVLIGKTNNAFRQFTFRVDLKLLKPKGNQLQIKLLPPREQILHNGSLQAFDYPADNQSDSIKTAPYIRQPQQEFGWGFAFPEIYTGFRVCPELHFGRITAIRKLAVETISVDTSAAQMAVHVQVRNFGKQALFLHAKGVFGLSTKFKMVSDNGSFQFLHRNPELWWPRGEGSRPFYSITVYVSNAKNEVLDSVISRYAVRTVKLVQEQDSIGQSFYFSVNGKAIYMEGANVVMPNEPFENERSAGLSAKELQYVLDSKMNMLRIWGGGTYLPEAFHDWADTAGVMIWQDLMFACSYYPDQKAFEDNVNEEVKQQTFRLIHHPSLALICGNNEIDVARKNWGWAQKYKYSEATLNRLNSSYERFFQEEIPNTINNVSTQVNYLASSPISNWGKPEDFTRGDNHDWGIWHGGLPFDAVSQRIPRFMSEYGFPSLPPLKILEKCLGLQPAEIQQESLVLSYKGLSTLKRYIQSKGYPSASLEETITSSQEIQKWHYIKMKQLLKSSNGRCMGNLWWQLNDVSPVMSWSLLDIEGNVKLPIQQ
jgi:beta-mannosidase